MLQTVVWRVLTGIPLLLMLSLLSFLLLFLVPGSAATILLDQDATPEAVAQVEAELGLDDPLPIQYGRWLSGLLRGDLGDSLIDGRPVTDSIMERLAVTVYISVGGMLIGVFLGISTGIIAALRPRSWLDRGVTIVTGIASAMPAYFVALLLVIAFAIQVQLFPAIGYTSPDENLLEWLHSITLPCLALGLPTAALVSRQTRSAMLSVLQSTYIRTARASAIPFHRIIFRHSLRNALIPVMTVIGQRFSVTLGLAFVVEQIFALPGLSDLLIRAVLDQDITIVQGSVMVIGLLVIIVNMIVDLSYAQLNPRVRLS